MKVLTFCWGNNERRKQLKGRDCIMLGRGKLNSVMIKFLDNNEIVITSGNALKPKKI